MHTRLGGVAPPSISQEWPCPEETKQQSQARAITAVTGQKTEVSSNPLQIPSEHTQAPFISEDPSPIRTSQAMWQ